MMPFDQQLHLPWQLWSESKWLKMCQRPWRPMWCICLFAMVWWLFHLYAGHHLERALLAPCRTEFQHAPGNGTQSWLWRAKRPIPRWQERPYYIIYIYIYIYIHTVYKNFMWIHTNASSTRSGITGYTRSTGRCICRITSDAVCTTARCCWI